jgi:hypothetical protein
MDCFQTPLIFVKEIRRLFLEVRTEFLKHYLEEVRLIKALSGLISFRFISNLLSFFYRVMVSCLYGCPPFHFFISTSLPAHCLGYHQFRSPILHESNLHDTGFGDNRTGGYHAFLFFIHMLSTTPTARTSELLTWRHLL